MTVGIPLCEYGPCLQPAVMVVKGIPLGPQDEPNQVAMLSRALPLCDTHYCMLQVWRVRYQDDPDCKVRIG